MEKINSDMIVAGTGHRPDKLGGYNKPSFDKLVKIASDWIKANKPTKIISGMALGWDTALAQAALDNNVPFIAAVPFKGFHLKWSGDAMENYHRLLSKAEEVVWVSEEGYAVWKLQKRNEWMVDNCDLVLALWNGTSGGTNNCIQYANKVRKPYTNVYDIWRK